MEMRPGRVPAPAHARDSLAARDRLTRLDQVVGVVRVDGDEPALVTEQYDPSVAALFAREQDLSRRCGEHGRTLGCGEIDPFVLLVVSHPESRDQHSAQGPREGLSMRGWIERSRPGARNLRRLRTTRRASLDLRLGETGGVDLHRALGAGNEEERPRGEPGGMGDSVLDAKILHGDAVRAGDAIQRLARADLVVDAVVDVVAALRGRYLADTRNGGDRTRSRRGARAQGHHCEGTSPGSAHPLSSSSKACWVRSRWSGVTEMRPPSKTASQSLPGTFSWACSSPPIQ